jgi:hypothetical protein
MMLRNAGGGANGRRAAVGLPTPGISPSKRLAGDQDRPLMCRGWGWPCRASAGVKSETALDM